jgi:hypothetical protein
MQENAGRVVLGESEKRRRADSEQEIAVVIVDGDGERVVRLARALRTRINARCTGVSPDATMSDMLLRQGPFDIALINAGEPALGALSFAVSHAAALGCPQMTFFASELSDPAVWALRDVAGDRMFSESDIVPWLEEAGELLADLARSRRVQAQARRALERLQAPRMDVEAGESLTLYRAESRFRESYIRALLLTEGSRKAAAQRAGVPYRTFIYILSKLGMTETRLSSEDTSTPPRTTSAKAQHGRSG